ncbi:amidohydrolase family protein [Pseudonocardia sp.]|uniref:amidohydrolase family protein n=1 Tax=Pseudonocardia sp. TaxID=60912 RepID=UPI00261C4901|nr:amidohydrolase family protein [Pseudonocardia sp.]MCW2717321.1 amidohydrolase [Pseudonocardia sp.]
MAGKKPEEFGAEPTRYDEMIPGCYDPKARLVDMDIDGVWGALCFPSFPRFAGTIFLQGEDRELAALCVQAWNDYMLDEWCATAPDRFIPLVILPLWDVKACVAEIHRTAAKGAKAIAFPENPVPLGLPSFHTDHWDRVLAAAEETGMPLCLHFGTSGKPPITAPEAPMAVMIALFGCNSMYATADLLFSPVLHNHPNLKIGLSEGGIGWMPYMLERLDTTWERHRSTRTSTRTRAPPTCSASTCTAASSTTGSVWRTATTSASTTSPGSATTRTRTRTGPRAAPTRPRCSPDVPDDEVHKIVELNTRSLYNFPA